MNIKKFYIKNISLILIISIIFLNLSFLTIPKKVNAGAIIGGFANSTGIEVDPTTLAFYANAGAAVTTSATENVASGIWQTLKKYTFESALAGLAKKLALALIQQLTDATVNWINNGFDGNPAYISNLDDFLQGEGGVADQAFGDFFASEPGLSFMCEPFQLQVKLALQLGFGAGLKSQIGCTFTQVTENVGNAINTTNAIVDLNGNVVKVSKDGWDVWLRTTLQPQNNPIGAYMIAKAALDSKVVTATENKKIDILNGQGAISFNKCVDTYIDATGNVVGYSEEYTGGFNRPEIPSEAVGNNVFRKQKCTMKTPGATITSMLGFKANSTGDIAKIQAAMADGIDNIIGALLQKLMDVTLEKIKEGVLDNKTSITSQAYSEALNNANDQITQTYNLGIDSINNGDILDPGQLLNYKYSTSTSTSTDTNYYGYTALDRAKNNANNLINSLMKSELTYQNNYLTAKNILVSAQNVFASSSECNMKANKSGSMLRAFMINSNVIENIKGTIYTDNYRILAQIPWNLVTIKTAVSNSTEKIAILDEASSKVSLAGSIDEVKDALIPVNSTSFNTDPQITMVTNIKTWLSGVQNMYNTEMCPIDLIKVMEIVSPATSTVSN